MMTKRVLSLLAGTLSICAVAFAQPAPPGKMSPGEALRADGDIPAAIAAFETRYREDPRDHENTLNLACALSLNRRFDECFKYLAIAVDANPTVAPLVDSDLVTARGDPRWAAFEDTLVARINATPGSAIKDVAFAKALWKLAAWDQAFFQEVGIAARKTGAKSSVVEAIWQLKFLIQKRNQLELDALLVQKGWPRIGDVGREAAMAAYLVVMHSNDGLQKKYLDTVKTMCEAGELPWVRYANMLDRSRFNDNLPQRYGTHTRYNEQAHAEEPYPLEDASKVNEWRKEVGLPPLQDSLKLIIPATEPRKD